jgi:hypothetical protein
MAVDMNSLLNAVNNSENAASAAVNGLGPNSTTGDLLKAQQAMAQYTIVAQAAASIVNSDKEAKQAPAQKA